MHQNQVSPVRSTLSAAATTYVSCTCRVSLIGTGGLVREYEENRRMLIEQQAVIASMPVKMGFGFETPPFPGAIAGPSRAKLSSPAISLDSKPGKPKRRKTPEYTDSEEESS